MKLFQLHRALADGFRGADGKLALDDKDIGGLFGVAFPAYAIDGFVSYPIMAYWR